MGGAAGPGETRGKEEPETVGLVGLGLLGAAIAERLVAAGFRAVGCDTDPARAPALGIPAEPRPGGIAERTRRVVLCLPDSDAVEGVVEGPGGLLAAPEPPRCIVDTTTGDPDRAEALAARIAPRGVRYIDAAVSGSSEDLRRGEASLLAGGEDEVVEAARDILDALAPVVWRPGRSAGDGLRAKLAANLLIGLQRLALAEALHLGERLGLAVPALLEILRGSAAYVRAIDTKGDRLAANRWTPPAARLAQHRKDVRLILEQARRAGCALPLSRTHLEVLDRAVASGHGDEDNSVVLEVLRELPGDAAPPESGGG